MTAPIPLCGDTQRPSGPGHLPTDLPRGETGPSGSLRLHSDKPGGLSPPLLQTQRTPHHPNHGLTRGQTRRQLQPTMLQDSHCRPHKPRRSRLQQVPALPPSPILLLPVVTHLQGHREKARPSARQLQKRLMQRPTPRRKSHHRPPTPR